MNAHKVFPTLIYQTNLLQNKGATDRLNRKLLLEIEDIADLDTAGKRWSAENYKNGYTSYGSANQLQKSSTTFAALEVAISRHVKKFSQELDFDLGGAPLGMTNCWVNIMEKNTHHSMHIHPLSVLSGTYYVDVPKGSSAIKFEDPRLGLFMNAPPKKAKGKNKPFFELAAKAGTLILFESWLRHEVPLQASESCRISISFNYGWGA